MREVKIMLTAEWKSLQYHQDEVRKIKSMLTTMPSRKLGTVMNKYIRNTIEDFDDCVDKTSFSAATAYKNIQSHNSCHYSLLQYVEDISDNVLVSYSAESTYFTSTFGQLRPDEIRNFYYGLLFEDSILIFKSTGGDIKNFPTLKKYQHRDNLSECQFHINRKHLSYNVEHYLFKKLSWDEFVSQLGKIKL